MADWGIKISKGGQDVGTAVDKNLIFSTKYNVFKTTLQGQTNLVIPAGSSFSGTTQINHGLGYPPMYFLYVGATDTQTHMAQTESYSGTLYSVSRSIYSWSDGTNLNFYINFGTAGTYSAYYYIFFDPV